MESCTGAPQSQWCITLWTFQACAPLVETDGDAGIDAVLAGPAAEAVRSN